MMTLSIMRSIVLSICNVSVMLSVTYKHVMLSVIMLNVVMLSVRHGAALASCTSVSITREKGFVAQTAN
jgi:hypothetical protein